MLKPVKKLEWLLGQAGPNIVEPTVGKKAAGWMADERPPAELFNWSFQNISDWIEYLDFVGNQFAAFMDIYAAIVGTLGPGSLATHASLADALADPLVVPGSRILIIDNLVIDVPVQVTKNFIEIECAGGVSIVKGAAILGIQVTATHFRFKSGRFQGFSGVGDKAIQVDALSKNAMFRDIVFANCATEIDDLSTNTSIIGCITEEV